MGRTAAILTYLRAAASGVIALQRGHLLGWVPVCLGVGIAVYFALGREPSSLVFMVLGAAVIVLTLIARMLPESLSLFAVGLLLVLCGVIIAGVRAHSVAGPVLGWRYYGPVEGRIVAMDRSQSDALRLTLDQVRMDRVPPGRTPDRVRISLHAKGAGGVEPEPGLRVMTTAHLSPPPGPVEPDGFDFQRHAWFARLGAVGYTRVPLMAVMAPETGQARLVVFRVRMAASKHIRAVLPGDTGGFAAAVTTGDRSGISRDTLEALRASNLAHLLAISGLHMGLLTAVVFGAMRILLAAHPRVALTWPTKGIAAIVALIAATGYLALSGGNVATERAFIMVGVALTALLLGRRALSLRAVAVAATVVLVLRPEALMGPGFQMSFAATTALVAVFGMLRGLEHDLLPRWARPVFGVFVSSLVAGLATAPVAAAHFNAVAHYGLVANLLSVPLMGILVIPAAVLSLVLAPLGLEWIGLRLMGLGLDWILGVAHWIAAVDGARGYVVAPGPTVLPLMAFGALVLVLWQGYLRWAGGVAVIAAFVSWHGAERPQVLIADNGILIGVLGPEGRALSKAKGAGFVARNWLENDGDGRGQMAAAKLWQEGPVVHLSGKRAVAGFTGCTAGQVVVASVPLSPQSTGACMTFDPESLRQTGAVALSKDRSGAWHITTARQTAGERPWSGWPDRERDQYVRINPTSRP